MIKVLFLSSSDNIGGAAKATLKLYSALLEYPLKLAMFVKKKITREPTINKIFTLFPATVHVKLDNFLLSKYLGKERGFWSLSIMPNWFLWLKLKLYNYDIIQLNWINGGFVPIRLLKYIKKPIVWRLSDSWPFTGGCHIPFDCNRYEVGCGSCPQLKSFDDKDLSYQTILRKRKYWKYIDLTVIAPSKWMLTRAKRSLLFREHDIQYIPTGVNLEIFKPLNIEFTRKKLGIPLEKRIILFGAVDAVADPNKGFHLLLDALNDLSLRCSKDDIELVIFGHGEKIRPNLQLEFKVTFVGLISDPSTLNEYYACSDVYVLPSLMENSPNTVIEAMSAGTPVVAFNACGTSELIDHLEDGYLASPYSPQDLANGMLYVLSNSDKRKDMRIKAREKIVDNYDIRKVAKDYYQLYQRIYSRYIKVDSHEV